MANPGYPQQPMQPQMQQQQPMGQPQPQAAAPKPKPVKSGTSKIVPVVVSAGLAVGTFCGLLFGVGTGEPADASPSTSESSKDEPKKEDTTPKAETKPADKVAVATPPAGSAAPAAGSAAPAAGSAAPAAGSAAPAAGSAAPAAGSAAPAAGSAAPAAGSAAPAAGSAATPAAGSGATTPPAGAGSAAKPTVAAVEPAVKKPKLTVEITPASVAATAKITVDGKAIEGNVVDVDLGKDAKKEVKIVVKASGYKTVEQKVDIDSDVAVKIELVKRPSTPSGGTSRPPSGTPTKPKKPPGGLIDI